MDQAPGQSALIIKSPQQSIEDNNLPTKMGALSIASLAFNKVQDAIHPGDSGYATSIIRANTDFGSGFNPFKALGRAAKLTSRASMDSISSVARGMKSTAIHGYEFVKNVYTPAVRKLEPMALYIGALSVGELGGGISDIAAHIAQHNIPGALSSAGKLGLDLGGSKLAYAAYLKRKEIAGLIGFTGSILKEYPLDTFKEIYKVAKDIPTGIYHTAKDISRYVGAGKASVSGMYAESGAKSTVAAYVQKAADFYKKHQDTIHKVASNKTVRDTAVKTAKAAMKSDTAKQAWAQVQSGDLSGAVNTVYSKGKNLYDAYNRNKQYAKLGLIGLGAFGTGYLGYRLYKQHQKHQQEKNQYNTIQGLHPGTDRPDWWNEDIAFGSGIDLLKVLRRASVSTAARSSIFVVNKIGNSFGKISNILDRAAALGTVAGYDFVVGSAKHIGEFTAHEMKSKSLARKLWTGAFASGFGYETISSLPEMGNLLVHPTLHGVGTAIGATAAGIGIKAVWMGGAKHIELKQATRSLYQVITNPIKRKMAGTITRVSTKLATNEAINYVIKGEDNLIAYYAHTGHKPSWRNMNWSTSKNIMKTTGSYIPNMNNTFDKLKSMPTAGLHTVLTDVTKTHGHKFFHGKSY